jgi:16S rRNA (cytidine1402-2'-O)-methyltransferase
VALIREATKIHEEIIRGAASELAALKRDWKGEFVIGLRAADAKDAGKRREEVLP